MEGKTLVTREARSRGYCGFLWNVCRWNTSQKNPPSQFDEVFEEFRLNERTHPMWVGESVLWYSRVGNLSVEKKAIALFRFAFTEDAKGSVAIPLEALRLYFVDRIFEQVPVSNRAVSNRELGWTIGRVYESLMFASFQPQVASPVILALLNTWNEAAYGPTVPGYALHHCRFGAVARKVLGQQVKKIEEGQLMALQEELRDIQAYMNIY